MLAKINTEKLEAQAAQARAVAAVRARPSVASAEAARGSDTRAAKPGARREMRCATASRRVTKSTRDAAEAASRKADASRASARGAGRSSRGQSVSHRDGIRKARHPLTPINGIVLDRQVDPGQTVAAIVSDANVVHPRGGPHEDAAHRRCRRSGHRQRARRPGGRAFASTCTRIAHWSCRVSEVRSTPKTSNGVVTYQTGALPVDNSERLLQPAGMTATADIIVTEVADAVLVPKRRASVYPARYPAERVGGGFRLLPTAARLRSGGSMSPGYELGQPRVWRLAGNQGRRRVAGGA